MPGSAWAPSLVTMATNPNTFEVVFEMLRLPYWYGSNTWQWEICPFIPNKGGRWSRHLIAAGNLDNNPVLDANHYKPRIVNKVRRIVITDKLQNDILPVKLSFHRKEDLAMRELSVHWILRLLTADQKHTRRTLSCAYVNVLEGDPVAFFRDLCL
jgi:hypothetical protein